ncbi:MAG: D-xylose ABC transporter substrate-binding protein [Actinobacteria bacterium]|nr:D-xylose ABC transporter substrate-binding protein [Actinomycetota bacterium]NDG76950.1 D-xylose ABC transporter substrate-binding protein [Acidimicrobiia bacterium]NBP18010.1 D-xylose ABC transporter substrate-binding protein [Actinomycetota bacterium]NBR76741.1 D-xylose ABC transporter substrate-binding protein [Actinomycetota bacterium]NBY58095.1 D-xylose ABC transporter substrate-binding protein [Actinomycetota bacterium]
MRKFAAVVAAGALLLAACGGDDESATTDTEAPAEEAATEEAAAEGCIVGVSWNNYQEERWAKWDEPAIKAAIEAGGGTYISNDAKSSAETQASNLENLISQGAQVLIVLAQDGTAIKPAVASAIGAGVPVVAYDRLIEDPQALYITFDNKGVGRLEAEEIFKRVPKGRYVIIKGSSTDANADFLREGFEEVIGAAVTAGDIEIVSETYTDNWDPANAQATMEQVLSAESNKIDAVLTQNDGMAGGAIAALAAQGLAGKVPVSGQDAEQAALNRVALGTQSLTVWKDARELGKSAGESALALCANADASAVAGASPFTTPGGNEISSIFLVPKPITQDNLNEVIDAGWTDQATLCQGVTAGSVAACP